jgi:hypothetical protein
MGHARTQGANIDGDAQRRATVSTERSGAPNQEPLNETPPFEPDASASEIVTAGVNAKLSSECLAALDDFRQLARP